MGSDLRSHQAVDVDIMVEVVLQDGDDEVADFLVDFDEDLDEIVAEEDLEIKSKICYRKKRRSSQSP